MRRLGHRLSSPIEPVRAAEIDFTAPYVLIEGNYLVPKDSALEKIDDVDRAGVRIAVAEGSAYDLYLSRTHQERHAGARADRNEAMAMFVPRQARSLGGVRQPLVDLPPQDPSLRVMEGRFMAIQQAMGMPKGRSPAPDYLQRLRRGDEGVGLRRRCAQAQQPARRAGRAGRLGRRRARATSYCRGYWTASCRRPAVVRLVARDRLIFASAFGFFFSLG